MKATKLLLFAIISLLFNVAHSKSVGDISEEEDIRDDYGVEGNQDDLQKRGYYWIVSDWGPCKCEGNMETGYKYREVTCTRKPCHFIRSPRFKQVCRC